MQNIQADYLVIGTGAVGMTFVDTMLDESDATFVMVDRHHLPGGHWNDAYPFVRLHQPSSYYGVASTELGSNRIDEAGSNKGYYALASGAEICAYFEKLKRERYLPSGRVQYFPLCSYDGIGKYHSLLSDQQHHVDIQRKLVDGTYYKTTVPSTHMRKFSVEESVSCIAPNELPKQAINYRQFTILGGGKTAMDTCVWLLDNGVDPEAMTWVCPRDSWLFNREVTQPGLAFYEQVMEGNIANIAAMAHATSVEDLFLRMEAAGTMMRVDPAITPTMYHYATLAEGELAQLRRLKHIIRGERVAKVESNQMIMQSGKQISATPQTLYVDCTAKAVGFEKFVTKPIFEPNLITLQPVFAPLVTYSAAIVAYCEANIASDEEKNSLCTPVVLADTPAEWMGSMLGNFANMNAWSQNKPLNRWIRSCRLNPSAAALKEGAGKAPEHKALFNRIRQSMLLAVLNTQKLIAALPESE